MTRAISVLILGAGASLSGAEVLYDNGINTGFQGFFNVTGENQGSNGNYYSTYQDFTVSGGGWNIESIEVAFWLFDPDIDGDGVDLTIFADIGDGSRPDRDVPVSITVNIEPLLFDPQIYAMDFGDLTLPDGTYWVGASAGGPNIDSCWVFGLNPDAGISYNEGTGEWIPPLDDTSRAMRINGTVVPAPASVALLGACGLAMVRRRR